MRESKRSEEKPAIKEERTKDEQTHWGNAANVLIIITYIHVVAVLIQQHTGRTAKYRTELEKGKMEQTKKNANRHKNFDFWSQTTFNCVCCRRFLHSFVVCVYDTQKAHKKYSEWIEWTVFTPLFWFVRVFNSFIIKNRHQKLLGFKSDRLGHQTPRKNKRLNDFFQQVELFGVLSAYVCASLYSCV